MKLTNNLKVVAASAPNSGGYGFKVPQIGLSVWNFKVIFNNGKVFRLFGISVILFSKVFSVEFDQELTRRVNE